MIDYDLTYLSLGAGVQSSALYVMSVLGLHDCPRADVAIFADTQGEPIWVYDALDRLEQWGCTQIPIERVTAGNLMQDVIDRHNGTKERCASIPAWVIADEGRSTPLRRHCTRDYKINPIESEVRRRLGYKPRQVIKKKAKSLIGISLDEASRMKPSGRPWIDNRFPLVEAGLRRTDCLEIIENEGLPTPKKSACLFCPFHSDTFWRDLKEYPEEWEKAVRFDEAIRDMSASGVNRSAYLHRSLEPLDSAYLGEDQLELWDNECTGHCGL